MNVSPDCELLLKALLAKADAAEAHWRRWRAQTDLEAMSEDCVRLLPVVAARSPSWLASDPARNLILGLAKRAWTRNQFMLRSLAELMTSLARAGFTEPVIAGPAAWAMRYQTEKSFRPIFFLELLIPRDKLPGTAAALLERDWKLAPGQALPRTEEFDYAEGIWFRNRGGEGLRLTWRLFPAPPDRTGEWEMLPPGEPIEVHGVVCHLPSRDVMLAAALVGYRDGDHWDWRCDAALLLNNRAIDWAGVRKWIQFVPAARIRLLELARETEAAIPFSLRRRPVRLWFQWDLVWGDYGRRTWSRGESRTLPGFFRYLCDRWQTPAWQVPFLGLFYLARYTFYRRPGGV